MADDGQTKTLEDIAYQALADERQRMADEAERSFEEQRLLRLPDAQEFAHRCGDRWPWLREVLQFAEVHDLIEPAQWPLEAGVVIHTGKRFVQMGVGPTMGGVLGGPHLTFVSWRGSEQVSARPRNLAELGEFFEQLDGED